MTSYLSTPPPPPSPRDGGIWDRRTGRSTWATAQRRAELQGWVRRMNRYGISGECVIAKRIDELEVELAKLKPEALTEKPSHPWLGQWVIVRRENLSSHYLATLTAADDEVATLGVWMGPSHVQVRLDLSLVVGLVKGSRWKVHKQPGEFEVVEFSENSSSPPRLEELKLRPFHSQDPGDRITRDCRTVLHFGAFVAGGGL